MVLRQSSLLNFLWSFSTFDRTDFISFAKSLQSCCLTSLTSLILIFFNKLQIYKCLSWVASENSSKCLWLSFWKTCFIRLYLLLRSNSYIFSWFWWIYETRWTMIMVCWMLVTMLLSSVWIFKNATTDLQSHSYSPNWKKMQPKSLMSPGILNG